MGRIEILARPGSSADTLGWDPWRKRWVVSCRAPPEGGRANDAIRELLAGWLRVSAGQVRWVSAGRSRRKMAEVDGVTEVELGERLATVLHEGIG